MSEGPAGGTLEVRPAASAADRKAFIHLPWKIYRGDPNWVPPLLADIRHRLAPEHPYFEHAEAELFLARRGSTVVGRIAATVNRLHEEIHGDGVGFFGWFECERDQEAATALIEAARAWVGAKGCRRMRGPESFSQNDECGLLVENFEPPMALMTYNPPWYEELLTGAGLEVVMNLYSYRMEVQGFDAPRIERIVKKVIKRENLTVRHFDKSRFGEEVERLKVIYNDAWSENWGFVPMTNAEIDDMAKALKPVLEPRLACFVEAEGEPVGFSLVLPNINEILGRMNGRLFPTGLFKILFGYKKVSTVRLIAMGIRREWQRRGIESVLYHENFVQSDALGKVWSEIGWVLETNQIMINAIERLGGSQYKSHRLYELAVADDPA